MRSRRTSMIALGLLVATLAGVGTVLAKSRRPDPEKHFATKDIRLHLPKPDDMTGWTQIKEYDAEKEANVILKLVMKKPDSSDPFDIRITAEGFDQNMTLTMKGPEGEEYKVSTGSVQRIAEIISTNWEKSYKDIKEIQKLKKTKISRSVKKGYYFHITGLREGAGLPLHQRLYAFSANGKTYLLYVLMTTTSVKNEAVVKALEKMIGGMIAWKP